MMWRRITIDFRQKFLKFYYYVITQLPRILTRAPRFVRLWWYLLTRYDSPASDKYALYDGGKSRVIVSGVEKLNSRRLFQMSNFQGRSHSKKLYPKYARLNLRKHWFTQRVIAKWNSLSQDEVAANKTSRFKTSYDKKEAEWKRIVESDK